MSNQPDDKRPHPYWSYPLLAATATAATIMVTFYLVARYTLWHVL